MPDLSLVWFSIDEYQVAPLDRDQVRAVSERLGLSTRMFSRDSKVRAFRQACRLRHAYTDDAGAAHTIRADIQGQRGNEFMTAVVLREDGLKMGEIKFFQAVKQRRGIPPGAVLVRRTVRTTMPKTDREAAKAWMIAAEETFTLSADEAQTPSVRRQARMSILRGGVPIMGRESMYFVYDDDMEFVEATRQFVAEVCPGTPFWVVGVDDDAGREVFAASADEWLNGEASSVLGRINRASLGPLLPTIRRHAELTSLLTQLRRQQARHERRLRLKLEQTHATLLLAEQLMSRMPPRDQLAQGDA